MKNPILEDAIYEVLVALPTWHRVRRHYVESYRPLWRWWEEVKHNTGPDWDDFRLRLIEEVHFK